jgi:hypothetical protein
MPDRSKYTEEQKAAEREKDKLARREARLKLRIAAETVEERWARNEKAFQARNPEVHAALWEKHDQIRGLEAEVNDIGWEKQVTSYYPDITECWKDVMSEAAHGLVNYAEIETSPEFRGGTPGEAIKPDDPADVYTKMGFRIRLEQGTPRRIENFLLQRVIKNPQDHGLDPAVVALAKKLGKERRIGMLDYEIEVYLGLHSCPDYMRDQAAFFWFPFPGAKQPASTLPASTPIEESDDRDPIVLNIAPPKRELSARFADFLRSKRQ